MNTTRPLSPPSRDVLFVLYPGMQPLELAGPLEIFKSATGALRERPGHGAHVAYRVKMAAASLEPIRAAGGLCVIPDYAFAEHKDQPIDTLFIPGGDWRLAIGNRQLVEFVAAAARRARRVVAAGTGSFILAQAGLLDERRATTHWENASELVRRFPGIRYEENRVYVEDGSFLTCAGATAAMDATLTLVRRDFGRELALGVARLKVMYVHREGEEAQISVHLAVQQSASAKIRQLAQWILQDPSRDYSVEILASHALVSTRTLCRLFRREIGLSPSKFVEHVRIEIARRILGEGGQRLESVAQRSGFGNEDRLRRAFQRVLHLNPRDYVQGRRRPFRTQTPEVDRRLADYGVALTA